MKKTVLFLITGLLLPVFSSANSNLYGVEEGVIITLEKKGPKPASGRPRMQEQPLFNVYLDTDLGALAISALYDCGEVAVTLENLSGSDYYTFSYDASAPAVFQVSCGAGNWLLTLDLGDDVIYEGEFTIVF